MLGEVLRKNLADRNLTKQNLAEYLGVSTQTVSDWISGVGGFNHHVEQILEWLKAIDDQCGYLPMAEAILEVKRTGEAYEAARENLTILRVEKELERHRQMWEADKRWEQG
jgi:transcriptional regulator with XRE-family HTH domain